MADEFWKGTGAPDSNPQSQCVLQLSITDTTSVDVAVVDHLGGNTIYRYPPFTAPAGPADSITAWRRLVFGASTPQYRCLWMRGGVSTIVRLSALPPNRSDFRRDFLPPEEPFCMDYFKSND
jgi:hypothetical protein